MTTRFTTTGKDKLQQLEVTRQTQLVVTDVKSELELLNIQTLMERLRNNPVEILEILDRIRNNRLKGSLSLIKGLKDSLLGDVLDLKESSLQKLIERLTKIVTDRALIAGLTEDQLRDLMDLLERAENKKRYNSVDYNGIATEYLPDDFDKAQRLIDALERLDPEAEVSQTDTLSNEALFTILVTDAVTLNANQIAIDLILKIDDPITRERLMNDSAYNAVLNSNLSYLTALLDHPTLGFSIEKLKATMPDWKQLILSSYRFPAGSTTNDHVALLAALLALMTRINVGEAVEWFYYVRETTAGNVNAFILELFAKASEDARTLFMLSPTLRHCIMISKDIKSADLIVQAKSLYPYALV